MGTGKTRLWSWLVLALVLALPALGAVPRLFRETGEDLELATALGIAGAVRHRLVEVDLVSVSLPGPTGPQPARVLLLNLFDDLEIVARLDSFGPSPVGGWVWIGHAVEPAGGEVLLAFDERTLAGVVESGGRCYHIRNGGGPVHLVRELATEISAQLVPLLYAPAAGSSTEMQVHGLTNAERAAHGIHLLAWNDLLGNAARAHSQDMGARGYFSHNSPEGTTPGQRMTAAGYNWSASGENIAAGQTTPAAVMQSWMNSAGHRANILSTAFCDLGVGYVFVGGSMYSHYWTQNFGKRQGVGVCPPVDPANPVLAATPSSRSVGAAAGSTTFGVANTGSGTMNWTASVTAGGSWLQITSGGSGTNSGTITVSFAANTASSQRTGTITVTAPGATGSPISVNVVQAGTGPTQNRPPTVSLAYRPASPTTADTVVFTASASDPDGDPLTYAWYLNGNLTAATAAEVTWSNPPQGTHSVRVVVSDGRGGTADASVTVTVRPPGTPPGDGNSHTYGNAAGWYLISVPAVAGPPSGITMWWWNASTRGYVRPTSLNPQAGYWARLAASTRLSVPGSPPTSDVTVSLAVTGWHLVSAPWSYPKSAIRVQWRGQEGSWAEAVAAGLVRNAIYGYRATDRAYTMPTAIHPWYGYWVEAKVSGLTLRFVYASRMTPMGVFSDEPLVPLWAAPVDLPPPPPADSDEPAEVRFGNTPNPVRDVDTTTFRVLGPMASSVTGISVTVYDLSGRLVWQGSAAGAELTWHTDDLGGRYLASGVYVYQITAQVAGTTLSSGLMKLSILR